MSGQRRGRGFWTGFVDEFEGRDPRPKHVDYAAEKQVCVGTFRLWLYRLRRERAAELPALSFVPVEFGGGGAGGDVPVSTAFGPGPIDAALPSGVVLRFDVGTDPEYIGALVRTTGRWRR